MHALRAFAGANVYNRLAMFELSGRQILRRAPARPQRNRATWPSGESRRPRPFASYRLPRSGEDPVSIPQAQRRTVWGNRHKLRSGEFVGQIHCEAFRRGGTRDRLSGQIEPEQRGNQRTAREGGHLGLVTPMQLPKARRREDFPPLQPGIAERCEKTLARPNIKFKHYSLCSQNKYFSNGGGRRSSPVGKVAYLGARNNVTRNGQRFHAHVAKDPLNQSRDAIQWARTFHVTADISGARESLSR
jgi:hypothetical protein